MNQVSLALGTGGATRGCLEIRPGAWENTTPESEVKAKQLIR